MWIESPSLRLLGELKGHWPELRRLISAGKIAGGAVHDARVAAICLEHGAFANCGAPIATSAASPD